MRRALLLANDFPPLSGGIAGYLFGLWRHLPRAETAILAPRVPGWQAFDRGHDLRVYRRSYLWRLPFPLDKLTRIALPWGYASALTRRERAEILHCGHVLTAGVVGLLLRRTRGLPYAVYAYGADLLDYRRFGPLRRLAGRVLAEAEGVVTISAFSAGLLRAQGVASERIHKVVMGIDTERFSPKVDGSTVRARHGLEGRPVLLTVARLVRRKGHDVVIQALPRIRAAVPGTAYLVVGTGPEEAWLARLAHETGVADHVVFAGFVPETELPAYYAAADCFVLCSRQLGSNVEGAGNVSLEASASGCPVVVGRSGGTEEHVLDGETGLLVDPADPEAVARAVTAVLADPAEARRLGSQGRQMVEERFVWPRTARALDPLR
jgi:phosphatidylinositol alpha-1,6-mannosyltransferase